MRSNRFGAKAPPKPMRLSTTTPARLPAGPGRTCIRGLGVRHVWGRAGARAFSAVGARFLAGVDDRQRFGQGLDTRERDDALGVRYAGIDRIYAAEARVNRRGGAVYPLTIMRQRVHRQCVERGKP
eukprot:3129285-Pleurochrysis_carterae.AAC.1